MHEPTGAVLAASTTSLPEGIGGTRNWDYGYCWLRDGSMTVNALVDLGSTAEAAGFLSWLGRILKWAPPSGAKSLPGVTRQPTGGGKPLVSSAPNQFSSSATPIMAGTATTVVIRTVSLATVRPVW